MQAFSDSRVGLTDTFGLNEARIRIPMNVVVASRNMIRDTGNLFKKLFHHTFRITHLLVEPLRVQLPEVVLAIALQVAEALQEAHDHYFNLGLSTLKLRATHFRIWYKFFKNLYFMMFNKILLF